MTNSRIPNPVYEFVDHQAERTFFIGGRQSGKTSAIVRWAQDDPAHRAVLVRDQREADRLHAQHPDVEFIDWQTPTTVLRGKGRFYGIDNLEAYVYHELGLDVVAYTATASDDTQPTDEVKVAREAVRLYADENARLRTQIEALAQMAGVSCDGRCVYADELLEHAGHGVAYADPDCSLHGGTDAQLRAMGVTA